MTVDSSTLIWSVINFLVVLSIPIAIIVTLVKFHRRLQGIEDALQKMASSLEKQEKQKES